MYIPFRKDHAPGLEEMQACSCVLWHFLQYWEISGSWAEGSIHGGKGNEQRSHFFLVFGQTVLIICALTIRNVPSRMLRVWDRRFQTGKDMLQRSMIFWWLRKLPMSTMMGKASGFHHLFHIVGLSHLSSCIINIRVLPLTLERVHIPAWVSFH